MRQLVCMSADVYCQINNNQFYAMPMFLYSNGKKGKRASCRRDRECARDGAWLKAELVSVVKWPLEEGLAILKFLGILT
jgi:hypothetical protein